MADVGSVLKSKKGRDYRLVKKIGSGGEGIVYTTDDPDLVIKIYKNPQPIMEKKLLCMLKHPLEPKADGKHLLIAWPQDVIYEGGTFVGYAMPFVKDTHPIYIVCRNNEQHKHDCHEVFPNYDWRYSLMVAYHLAWVVNYVHKHGYVIGDMNSNNIVIHSDGSITILDVDSFDITDPDTGERFPCNVGIAEFLAPELQGRNLRTARFDQHTDEFSLAIHIFILLMNNTHPFTLRQLSDGELAANNVQTLMGKKQSTVQDQKMINMVNGYCPYIKNIPGYGKPLYAPDFNFLPIQIQKAFRNTFSYDSGNVIARSKDRTSADLWRWLLYQYFERTAAREIDESDKRDVIRCKQNREHYYIRSRGKCAFCEIGKRPVPAMAQWDVQILCYSSSVTQRSVNEAISEGSTAYVHFNVTKGPLGQQGSLNYSWTSPGNTGAIKPMSTTFGVNESGHISHNNVKPGRHTVAIFDANKKKLAEKSFEVEPKKKGFLNWLFG